MNYKQNDEWPNENVPVPLVDLSVAVPLISALPLVLLDVIVDEAFDPDDGCGFNTMYLDLRSWTELLKVLACSYSIGDINASFDDATN